jgi:hypothetical protein
MRRIDSNRLERIGNELAPLFYALMLAALLAILVGAAGSGAALLILGAGVHVVRASCIEFATSQRLRADRLARPVRSRRDRAVRRPERARAVLAGGGARQVSR